MNKKIVTLLLVSLLGFSCNFNRAKSTIVAEEQPTIHSESKKSPEMNTEPVIDVKFAEKYPLIPRQKQQKELLEKTSKPATIDFEPDGTYLQGKFSSGQIVLTLTGITEEPGSLVGRVGDSELELDFLAFKITMEELEALVLGKEYIVHWLETICYLEPFEQGYERRFVVYGVE